MADVTFVRGYGFPRGSSMDYAGYSGHASGRLGTYERPGGIGADGCPIATVRVGNRCVPFSQLSGYAGKGNSLGTCGGNCGCGGGCGQGPVAVAMGRYAQAPQRAYESSLFATIPSLDGYDATDFEEGEEITPSPMVGPANPTPDEWAAMKGGNGMAVGLGLLALGAALFLKW